MQYLGLPWLIQLLLLLGPDVRLYRTLFLADIQADYVRTARSKGASEARVLFHHVLPNAWIPIITRNVTQLPFLVLGSFLMERFFSIPGIGNLTIDALMRGDLPILKAVTVLGALALVAAKPGPTTCWSRSPIRACDCHDDDGPCPPPTSRRRGRRRPLAPAADPRLPRGAGAVRTDRHRRRRAPAAR